MQYIDVNAATTDIAGNCGANQLSSNVILAALIWSSRHRQALPRRWLSARQAPHMNLQPCTNASSWSMMCPVTHRPSSARAPHCPCSANSAMQDRTSCPAGTSRTWRASVAGQMCIIATRSFGRFLEEHNASLSLHGCQSLLHWRVIARR